MADDMKYTDVYMEELNRNGAEWMTKGARKQRRHLGFHFIPFSNLNIITAIKRESFFYDQMKRKDFLGGEL